MSESEKYLKSIKIVKKSRFYEIQDIENFSKIQDFSKSKNFLDKVKEKQYSFCSCLKNDKPIIFRTEQPQPIVNILNDVFTFDPPITVELFNNFVIDETKSQNPPKTTPTKPDQPKPTNNSQQNATPKQKDPKPAPGPVQPKETNHQQQNKNQENKENKTQQQEETKQIPKEEPKVPQTTEPKSKPEPKQQEIKQQQTPPKQEETKISHPVAPPSHPRRVVRKQAPPVQEQTTTNTTTQSRPVTLQKPYTMRNDGTMIFNDKEFGKYFKEVLNQYIGIGQAPNLVYNKVILKDA